MSDPVNLNKFRKARAKSDRKRQASENRVRFGRTKSEKQLAKSRVERLKTHVGGHKLTSDDQS